MKKIITMEQQLEIAEIACDHGDALIAFGADMYRKGLCKGMLTGAIGFATGMLIGAAIDAVKQIVKNRKEKEITE